VAAVVTCAMCGRAEKEPPPTWTCQQTGRGRMWLCEECTRQNVRSIEGRLDEAWW
jgi:hypothetical protein